MTRRSRAREVALQLLFQADVNASPMPRPVVEKFANDRLLGDADLKAYCLELFDGVCTHRAKIDEQITKTAENWRLHRIMPVDRNVLRLGTYELVHAPVPTAIEVAVNEAVELSRRFGTLDSPSFVNGILDKIGKTPAEPETPVPPPLAEALTPDAIPPVPDITPLVEAPATEPQA